MATSGSSSKRGGRAADSIRHHRLGALRGIVLRPGVALLAAGAMLSIALLPADARAQSRRGRTTQPATETAADTLPTVATSEEPTDLAFRTLGGRPHSEAGRERSIAAPPHLTQQELRVLDTRRRTTDPLVPLRGYPTAERATVPSRPGYADASIGMHTTARVQAGYSGTSWPFDYRGTLAFDVSNGYADDNPHRSISIGAGAGYIIDEGFGIFSGGHMGADALYENSRYRLFALPDNPERTADSWSLAATGSNTSGGFGYDASARYRGLAIDDDTLGSRETSLDGSLELSTSWQGLAVGAQTDLRLTYLDGRSISYGRLQAFGSYSNRLLTARAGVELAAGANSDSSTSGTIAPTGELRLFPLHGLTIIGTITGGLSPTSLAALSRVNPYIALEPSIRQQRENIGYQVHVRIEPSRAFALRATASRSHYNDYAYFDSLRDGRFAPQYGSATVNRIIGDLSWRMDEHNSLLASAEFTEGSIDDDRVLRFTPKWVADLLYTRRLTGIPLSIDAGARYIGPRPASGARTLEQVILLNLTGRYAVATRFDLTLELRNLFDQRYQLWEGYDERGIFAAVGARVRF